jgi:hypothetical protein
MELASVWAVELALEQVLAWEPVLVWGSASVLV